MSDTWISSRASRVAASGLRSQSGRMRVIAENLANADSTAEARRRRSLSAQDPDLRAPLRPRARRAGRRASAASSATRAPSARSSSPATPPPTPRLCPLPNVNSLIETMDMREAQRSYEANLNLDHRDAPDDRAHPRHPARLTGVARHGHVQPSPPAPMRRSKDSAALGNLLAQAARRGRRRKGSADFSALLGKALERRRRGRPQGRDAGRSRVANGKADSSTS